MSKTFTYGRKEKLKSRKQLSNLFDARQSFLQFPIKVFYLKSTANTEDFVKVGVGANKRFFKKAVHRNRIKRLLREAYRLNKLPLHSFLKEKGESVAIFFLYVDKALPDQIFIEAKMQSAIAELIKRLS